YKLERANGEDKRTAIENALNYAIPSVIVSALGLFAATFGVGLYSDIDIIGSLCSLMARGALISLFCVVFILPSLFMVFDKVICKTSKGFLRKKETIHEANLINE
ncbi:MAG: MMPL family transporter, partial [Eubacterium sp.]